jgi:6-phosphogluconolactonase
MLYEAWNVILADERCVPASDDDSNLKALKENLFSVIPVPQTQVYGINEAKLVESAEAVAADYEDVVRRVLSLSGGQLDLACLGMGPGTCGNAHCIILMVDCLNG